jgi:hypothetical protein
MDYRDEDEDKIKQIMGDLVSMNIYRLLVSEIAAFTSLQRQRLIQEITLK